MSVLCLNLRVPFSPLLNSGNNLLYRFERGQYADARRRYITGQHVVIGEEKTMGEVYGAEHLLRMLGMLQRLAAVLIQSLNFADLVLQSTCPR